MKNYEIYYMPIMALIYAIGATAALWYVVYQLEKNINAAKIAERRIISLLDDEDTAEWTSIQEVNNNEKGQ